jgi:hypothetical protein
MMVTKENALVVHVINVFHENLVGIGLVAFVTLQIFADCNIIQIKNEIIIILLP